MKWKLVADYESLSSHAAEILLWAVAENPRLVLGLPTGRTPEGMYARVARDCQREYRCFREVTSFNLDEYVGIPPSHPASYSSYMRRALFDHVDMEPPNIHIPDGTAEKVRQRNPELSFDEGLEIECANYEILIERAGSLGLTILGLGRNGHIGFNEPNTPFDSRTHVVELDPMTREANARPFAGEQVPGRAITMGIGTILESARILLLASGESKVEAVTRLFSELPSDDFPASALRQHHDVTILVDERAASRIRGALD